MQRNIQKFFRLFFARALRFARRALNLLLFVILLLQLFVLWGVLSGVSVPVPRHAEEFIRQKLYERGLQLEVEKISIDFIGGLHIDSPKVRFLGTSSNFFEARSVFLRLDHSRLVFGELKALEVFVHDARLAPSTGPSDGVWIAENISLRAFAEGGDFDVKNAFAKVGRIYLSISGRFPKSEIYNGGELLLSSFNPDAFDFLKEAGGDGQAPKVEGGIAQKWDETCRRIDMVQKHAEVLNDPTLMLRFDLDSRDGLHLFVQASADSLLLRGRGEPLFTAGELLLAANYNSGESKDTLKFSFRMHTPGFLDMTSLSALKLHATLDFAEKKLLNPSITFIGGKYKGMSVDSLWLGKDEFGIEDTSGDIDFGLNADGETLLGRIQIRDKIFHADFEGSVSAREIFKSTMLPDVEELKMFEFRRGLYLSGSVDGNLESLPESIKAELSVSMADSNFFGVEADWVFGDISYDGQSGDFWARDTWVKSREGWIIGGDVYQNLNNLDYRFLLKGALRPMAIAHFMEPWWAEVFTETEFDGDFPLADFSVIGRWLRPEIIYVYGSIYANDAKRNGVPFEHVDLIVWVNPERIALMDVNVTNQGRWARANLDWVYYSKQIDNYDENRVYAVSTLSRAELIGMGGPKVEEAIEILNFENAPEVSIKLFMPSLEKYPDAKDKINLDFFSKGTTHVGKISLEDLRFRAYLDGDEIWLDNMHFSIAKGAGSGGLYIAKKDGKDWIDLDAKISGARQDEFLTFLASLGDEPPAKGETVGLGDFDKFGILSGEVSLSGFIDEPVTIKGAGTALVKNPKLAELHLLGMISRAASAIGFPIASFDLNEAVSPFKIENGIADFSDIVVTGPTARITAKARYDFLNDHLNASGIMAPFAAMDASLISAVVKIVNPFMSVLEVSMTGEISDPKVSVSLKPLNLFRSDESIVKNIERKLDEAEEKRSVNGVQENGKDKNGASDAK